MIHDSFFNSDMLIPCYSYWFIPCNSFVQVKTTKLVTALDIGGFGVVFAATTFTIRELDLRIKVIGMICACLNVLMYGSPLASMVKFFSYFSPF